MKNTLFLIVGQNFIYNMKIVNNETTIVEVFNYVLSNDLIHEHSIEIAQSETGKRTAGWGRIVYKINDDGTLVMFSMNVDSSG